MSATPRTDAYLAQEPDCCGLANLTRTLERELAQAVNSFSETVKWVPVMERLPVPEVVGGETADFVPVLFYAGGMVCAGRFFPDFSARKRIYKWRSLQGMEFKDADVTHWMPLPEAPK